MTGYDPLAQLASLRLDDVIDRRTLEEVATSAADLQGLSVRIVSADGGMLADAPRESPLHKLIPTTSAGRAAQARTIDALKRAPGGEVPCVLGFAYRVTPLEHDGRVVGRIVVGPYLADDADPLAADALRSLDLDRAAVAAIAQDEPRAPRATVISFSKHLARILTSLLHAGTKSLMTSQMHLASVTESFRELEAKNQELADAVDRLKELDRLKSNFLATVSHELRTPLTSIIGYSEMLSEGISGTLNAEQAEFVSTIREKGEHLLSLILNLLDLSKLESGTMRLRRATISVAKPIDEVVSTLLPLARKKEVTLRAAIAADLPLTYSDGEKLRQVFLNLTENALKFTPKGGSITLSARAIAAAPEDDVGFVLVSSTSRAVEVRIADTGIGIPPSERKRVFDAFYQVDSTATREYGGTGLGLSIVKRIVEAHDGRIAIEGNDPTGTVFVVTLPTSS